MLNRLLLATTTVGAAALVLAAPASATPKDCWHYTHGMYATAYCDGGAGGAYQVYAVCKMAPWPNMEKFMEGPWRPADSRQYSEIRCPFLYDAISSGVGLKR